MFQYQLKVFILKTILNLDKFFWFLFPSYIKFYLFKQANEKKKNT